MCGSFEINPHQRTTVFFLVTVDNADVTVHKNALSALLFK